MGVLQPDSQPDWATFGRCWLPAVLAIFLRITGRPWLAFDLATETLAAAGTEWDDPPRGDDGIVALIELGGRILAAAGEHGSVPAVERRRQRQSTPLVLSIADQQAVMRMAEAPLELAPAVRIAVEDLSRRAPAPASLRQIRGSGLIEAEPHPDQDLDQVQAQDHGGASHGS